MGTIRLRVRETPASNWVENFSQHGWRVRNSNNNGWVTLTPKNTRVRSADNTAWLNVK